MVNGITFSEQLITSENFAHFMYTFLNHANGVTKGCGISNANGKVYIQKGYFIVFGRMVQIVGTEEIPSPEVISGQVYCKVVFEVDLSKENTAEEFIQGAFKTLTSTAGYPSVRQEDLDDGGKVYQMPWCQYIKQAGAIKDFRDLREILDLNSIWNAISSQNTQYKGEFDDYFAAQRSTILSMIAELEGQGYATTAELNDVITDVDSLSTEVAATKKSVSDGKALVAAAITAKRVATAATATFAVMKANIDKIRLGSGNALKAHVLAGRTFTNDDGVEYTGEMPEHGSKSVTLPINGSQDLPAGHYSGVQIRQSIPTLGGTTITPGGSQQTVASSGKYMTGNVVVPGFAMPPANVIKKGYVLRIYNQQVTGTCEGYFPTPNDLYLHGNNPAGFTSSSDHITLYLDRIEIADTENGKWLDSKNRFDFTGHANLKVDCELCCGSAGARQITFFKDVTSGWNSYGAYTVPGSSCTGRITITIPLPANMGSRLTGLQFGASITGNIYRIWLE